LILPRLFVPRKDMKLTLTNNRRDFRRVAPEVNDGTSNGIIYPSSIAFILVHLACFGAIWSGITGQVPICVFVGFFWSTVLVYHVHQFARPWVGKQAISDRRRFAEQLVPRHSLKPPNTSAGLPIRSTPRQTLSGDGISANWCRSALGQTNSFRLSLFSKPIR
jgi:hypothetical protein